MSPTRLSAAKQWWRLRHTYEMNRRFTRLAIICLVVAAVLSLFGLNLSPNSHEDAIRLWAAGWEKLALCFGLLYFAIRRIGHGLAKLICSVLLLTLFGTLLAMMFTPTEMQHRAQFLLREGIAAMQKEGERFASEVSALKVEEVFEMLTGQSQPTIASLEHSRQQAQLASLRVAQHEQAIQLRIGEIRQNIGSVDAASGQVVAELERALPAVKQRLQLQRRYFDEIASLSSFLMARINYFTVGKDGFLIFESQPDRDTFKVSLEHIAQYEKTLDKVEGPTSAKKIN